MAGIEMSFCDGADSVVVEFKPRVTVVIPVYNGAEFLAQAITSVLEQTYRDIELIVVNDGSNDDGATDRIVRSFGNAIRYYTKSNGGVASALNLAVQEMSGEYFSWLSHDDLYAKDKISRQIDFLSSQPEHTIVYSDYSIFTGKDVGKAVPVTMPTVQAEYFRYWITAQSALHGCSLLIPRSAFEVAGSFHEGLRTTQDYELWFRMAGTHRFVHIPELLLFARSHGNQDTHRFADLAFAEAGDLYLEFVKSMSPSEVPGSSPAEVGSNYLRLASGLWQRGFNDAAAYSVALARRYGVSFYHVLGSQLLAVCARSIRRYARAALSPQRRQTVRRVIGHLLPFHRGR
ncbi:glycosyltransferase [Pseudomonas atacamensis]|uniref:glycosyltransferase n=1 Tax=Pseudomonas atacamensis TaxID=2565368 RepID=UPI001C3DEC0B|nr:glycosyltransferase [Pseudomonas atacamensis]QXH71574.1 glycosyltransferase [Pseudomonas atacamensis]